ncbi:MAG: hypothetical protein Q7S45_04605 [Candidatus Curtissbacteria bacterium]|nr:hypothetical protein [Candidatus Curtissbacteria bacterium]
MANINAPKVEYFESFAQEVQSKFRRIKELTANKVASGDYHEEVIRTILRNFLTKRFSVKTGFIFRNDQEVSNQIDIIVIDESSPAAYLFQEGDFAIVLPEAVIAVIEVKTSLKAGDFDQAIRNVASVKALSTTIKGIVFGYDGTSPLNKNLHNWFTREAAAELKGKESLGPDAIFFFDAGSLLMRFDEEGRPAVGGLYYKRLYRDESGERGASDTGWQLSIILAIILGACEGADFRKTHYFSDTIADKLIQMEGASASLDRFSFGDGLSANKLQDEL